MATDKEMSVSGSNRPPHTGADFLFRRKLRWSWDQNGDYAEGETFLRRAYERQERFAWNGGVGCLRSSFVGPVAFRFRFNLNV